MSPEVVGLIGVIVLVALVFFRVWVGIAMSLVGIIGFAILANWEQARYIAATEPFVNVSVYTLTALPLFILMGTVASHTGISADLYNTAYKWLGRARGGLAMATVAACGAFAAICGSSTATAATMGKVAYPEMKKHGYDTNMASGVIAAGGTIGILIPPSMGFILYGLLAEQSIGQLFMAGIIPGILQVVFYIFTVYIICKINPRLAPQGEGTSFRDKFVSLKDTWPMLCLFLLVMGGIYRGVFTPTEAGAIGAFGSIVICVVAGKFNWENIAGSFRETAQVTAMIVLMMAGAYMFNRFIAISQMPFMLSSFLSGLAVSKYVILLYIIIFYLILGCFLDIFACIILTVPIILPTILSLGFNPIWFGVLMVRMMEIGQISPPWGLNCFVLSSTINVPIGKVFRGVIPFIISDFAHVALLVAVPSLALYLPQNM